MWNTHCGFITWIWPAGLSAKDVHWACFGSQVVWLISKTGREVDVCMGAYALLFWATLFMFALSWANQEEDAVSVLRC